MGSSERDAEDIKAHPFFAAIDWKALEAKQIAAPFKPPLSGKDDIRNFDKVFTKEEVVDTPALNEMAANDSEYAGFTYARPEMSAVKRQVA